MHAFVCACVYSCVCVSILSTNSRYHTQLLRESAIGILMELGVFDCVCFPIRMRMHVGSLFRSGTRHGLLTNRKSQYQ